MINRAVLEHGFKDTGGKPWLKGWIESFFNLMHNVAGFLDGQKGSIEMLNAPADLKQKLQYTERLIGTGPKDARLSDEQLAKAKVPFLSPEELTDAYIQIFQWIEERTDHSMEGFNRVVEWQGFRQAMIGGAEWDTLCHFSEGAREMRQRVVDLGMKEAIKSLQA